MGMISEHLGEGPHTSESFDKYKARELRDNAHIKTALQHDKLGDEANRRADYADGPSEIEDRKLHSQVGEAYWDSADKHAQAAGLIDKHMPLSEYYYKTRNLADDQKNYERGVFGPDGMPKRGSYRGPGERD